MFVAEEQNAAIPFPRHQCVVLDDRPLKRSHVRMFPLDRLRNHGFVLCARVCLRNSSCRGVVIASLDHASRLIDAARSVVAFTVP